MRFSALMVPVLFASVALAQLGSITQSVTGNVRQANGAAAADARVEVRDLNTAQVVGSGYTSKTGHFEILHIPHGRYEVVVNSGLDEARERVDVASNQQAVVQMRLPGSVEPAHGTGTSSVSVAQLQVPNKARKSLKKASEAMGKREMQKALQHVTEALEAYPSFAEALTLRAVIHLDNSRAADAITDTDAAVKADPNYALAYVVMGAARNTLGEFDAALQSLERGLSLAPDSWQAHFESGKAYMGRKDYTRALRALDRAKAVNNGSFHLLHLVRAHALLGLESYGEAMAELQAYLERAPQDAHAGQARKTLAEVQAFVSARK